MTEPSVPAIVPAVIDEPPEFTVIASSPKEMEAAQRSLIEWCERKVEAEKAALREVQEQLHIAKKANWKADAWAKQAREAERRVEFYWKVKLALDAGYFIVPPFPIDVFAIRTNRHNPDRKTSTRAWDSRGQNARILPAGEGRYVASDPEVYYRTIPLEPKDGKPQERKEYFAEKFLPVDFPFKLAKPEVMKATAKAMALKLFDQLGVLPAFSSPDPIVCGQILAPHRRRQPITFFVSWWLDTRSL